MSSSRHELNEIKQESEQIPQITIQPASQAAALDIRLPGLNAEKDKVKAAALDVAFTYPYSVGDSAPAASVSKSFNSLFQPPPLGFGY